MSEARYERAQRAEEARVARQERMEEDLEPFQVCEEPLFRRMEREAQERKEEVYGIGMSWMSSSSVTLSMIWAHILPRNGCGFLGF